MQEGQWYLIGYYAASSFVKVNNISFAASKNTHQRQSQSRFVPALLTQRGQRKEQLHILHHCFPSASNGE
jgi:hypothetical protein